MDIHTKIKEESKSKEKSSDIKILYVMNDDYNTFDWVITCLMDICGHDYDQANQCTLLIHLNGKCDVKHGDIETIYIMKEKLINAGLSATIK